MCHVSWIMCYVSCVMDHVSCVMDHVLSWSGTRAHVSHRMDRHTLLATFIKARTIQVDLWEIKSIST